MLSRNQRNVRDDQAPGDLANVRSAPPLPDQWRYKYNHESAADKTSHSNSCNGRPARKKSENW